jgi:hypothetical protein
MHRLRLVLVVTDYGDAAQQTENRDNVDAPAHFMPHGITHLEKWVDWPVVPNLGHHMRLGSEDLSPEIVSAVIHGLDEDGPYYEVQFPISEELAFIIGYQNNITNGNAEEYKGFVAMYEEEYRYDEQYRKY